MKIVNTDKKKCSYLPNNLRNFNEIFRKIISYDNDQGFILFKKPGLYSLCRKYSFEKMTVEEFDHPAFLRLK